MHALSVATALCSGPPSMVAFVMAVGDGNLIQPPLQGALLVSGVVWRAGTSRTAAVATSGYAR